MGHGGTTTPTASPVRITRPDGTTTTRPAYTPAELRAVKASKRRCAAPTPYGPCRAFPGDDGRCPNHRDVPPTAPAQGGT